MNSQHQPDNMNGGEVPLQTIARELVGRLIRADEERRSAPNLIVGAHALSTERRQNQTDFEAARHFGQGYSNPGAAKAKAGKP